jgi:hypothetical protein
MYCSWNLLGLGAAIGVAAPLANTSADNHFRLWYQRQFVGGNADHWASECRRFGDLWIVVPVVLGSAAIGGACPEWTACSTIGEWGCRSTRGLIVGAPTVAIVQIGLGTGRPFDAESSAWHPLHDHQAVATEAFVGAVPFLTAASMTKNRPLRWAFFGGSFIATWACIHNDSHYLSQSLLGWGIGAVATCSVNQTEAGRAEVELTPIAVPQGVGVGLKVSY